MKLDPSVSREWLLARDVIAQAVVDTVHLSNPTTRAAAILARLASHDPPLLVTTKDVFDQRDALEWACRSAIPALMQARDELGGSGYFDSKIDELLKALPKAETR